MSKSVRLDWEQAKTRLQVLQSALENSQVAGNEEIERAWKRRAEILARTASHDEPRDTEKILVLKISGSRFGLLLSHVSEVIAHPKIAPVPGSPPTVAGLIQVRGEVRPVWNLRTLLDLSATGEQVANGKPNGAEKEPPVILLRHATREIGIIADEIEDIVASPDDRTPTASPDRLPGSWLTPDFVTVLDSKSIFEKLIDSL